MLQFQSAARVMEAGMVRKVPPREVQVLLYEDTPADGRRLSKAIVDSTPPDVTVRIVWFLHSPNFPESKVAVENDDDEDPGGGGQGCWSDSFPLVAPQSLDVKVWSSGRWKPQRGHRWWQGDFDGAMLDVYEGIDYKAGEDFARWLAYARFSGPVIMTSGYNLRPSKFPLLPGMEVLSKKGNLDWPALAAQRFWDALPPAGRRLVGMCGRNPKDPECVRRFWNYVSERRDPMRSTNPSRSLWFGSDHPFAENVLNFLCHDLRDIRGSQSPDAWLNQLRNIEIARSAWPDFVWTDCGANLKIEPWLHVVDQIDRLKHPTPVLVFLGDRLEDLTADQERALTISGGVCLTRSELTSPGRWATNTVEQFVSILSSVDDKHMRVKKLNRQSGNSEPSELKAAEAAHLAAIERLLPAFFRLLLMARSNKYVTGDGCPSIVDWFVPYPLSGLVTTTFEKSRKYYWKPLQTRLREGVFARIAQPQQREPKRSRERKDSASHETR